MAVTSSCLVVHIGLPKTGTTAAQEFFAANHGRLLRAGVRWSQAVPGPNHAHLAVAFSERRSTISTAMAVTSPTDRDRLRRRLHDRLAHEARAGHVQLLSSEHLAAQLRRPAEVAALADFLHGLADQVVVLVALRRVDYWLPSSYSEAVHGGSVRRLDAEFVRRRRHLLDQQDLLTRWVAAFGASAVRLVPYFETDRDEPTALPNRLLAAAGLGLGDVRGWPAAAPVARSSLSARATEVLRQLNPQLPSGGLRPSKDRRRFTVALAQRCPGPPVALTPVAHQALEQAGWLDAGIETTPQASGPGWAHWRDQVAAPVRRAPRVPADEVAAVLAELRLAGVVPRGGGEQVGRLRQRLIRARH
jgi:hypothetical protein